MNALPAASERLSVEGPAGLLQALAEDPPGGAPSAPYYAVVCHPHPLFGGTLDNKVVYTLARALGAVGIPNLRFNFRGVGASAGEFDHGDGETADAAAIVSYGARRWPGRKLVLAGFSFGAYVALRLANECETARLIAVAPPVGRFDFREVESPRCPWLVVQGDADDIVDPKRVIAWVSEQSSKPQLILMPGAGHFFHGHLPELKQAVIDAIQSG